MYKLIRVVGALCVLWTAGVGCSPDVVPTWEKYCDAEGKCTGADEGNVAACKAEGSTNETGCSNAGDIVNCIDGCLGGGCAALKSCVAACPACQP